MSWLLSSEHAGLIPTLQKAPTCYRAPRWPARNFKKKNFLARNSGPPENTPEIPDPRKTPPKFRTPGKHPENTPKIPKMSIFVFFLWFWGSFSGVPHFQAGGTQRTISYSKRYCDGNHSVLLHHYPYRFAVIFPRKTASKLLLR